MRHSFEDRKGDPRKSPFRLDVEHERYIAATRMIVKRTNEVVALSQRLAQATSPAEKKRLRQRLLATQNNLRSWQDYMTQHCPREQRAVIIPAA